MKRSLALSLALFFLFPVLLSASPILASASPAPAITATFTATPFYVGTAEGSLAITATDESNLPEAYVLAWGDKNGPLADHKTFEEIPCTGKTTMYYTAEASVVPNTADRMLVYPVYDGVRAEAFATAYLPIEFFTYDFGTPIASFVIASDVHINVSNFENYNDHFKALLADAKATMPNADAIIFNGDIADWGRESEYRLFRQFLDEADLPFPFYTNFGNHDSRVFVSVDKIPDYYPEEDLNQLPDDFFQQYSNMAEMEEIYFTVETENVNLVFFASSETHRLHEFLYLTDNNLTWLNNTLQTVTQNGKKTFVLFHQPLANTVSGTFYPEDENINELSQVRKVRLGAEVAADNDLLAVLANYPEVVVFTSHTHRDLATAETLSLRDIFPYVLNTASTAYISRGDGERYNGAQALYLEVYENAIFVRGRDVLAGKWIPEAQFALDFGMQPAGEMGPVPTPPAEDTPPVNDPPAKGGCGGILTTATLPLTFAALGTAVLLKKKRR